MRRTTARLLRFFHGAGGWVVAPAQAFREGLLLTSELVSWSAIMLVRPGGARRGAFLRNALDYGLGALPIIGVITFLVGFVSALQSAAQLRMVGANIFVADLLAIGMTAEMGPLMAAIIVTGRSGSSIASEIATMKYTEEIDALRTLGLSPIRFVMVPKLWAMLFSMPILTLFSDASGILGGTVIGIAYLDLSFDAFSRQLVQALMVRHLISGIVKSLVFGTIITAVGCYYGMRMQGGADGVGRATTRSVVTSIFAIVAADAVLGLLFYF